MADLQEPLFVPEEVMKQAEAACLSLLPRKSKDNYDKEFRQFEEWREQQGLNGVNEEVMLAYFHNYRRKLAPSSMWTKYSMVKSTLKVYKNVDISKYGKLISYLKNEARTHKPKKAKTLEREHVEKFLTQAPDSKYLMIKVALVMGISGACRCDEITKLTVDDIEDKGGYLYVSIPDSKTNVSRSFTIMTEGFSINILELYRKYVSLRPKNVPHRRFFVNYQKEKCTIQAVGINTISKVPQAVASFLNLPEAHSYTGHSMRRASATLLANAGADITTLKRHGGWKSSTVDGNRPRWPKAISKIQSTTKSI
ncbi:uncharacterized protein LOC116163974 [Photinus pyralis]|uniref:uncharacterized protein LOC116163974 n=1 Tax=Photinus pyralis TaxID=7054 RepID=UPI0012676F95|nr:uncharacterized protein LOC116163974 [Photinus pyralis]